MSQITDDVTFKSTLVSRNITIDGRRTSVRLEPDMWKALKDISEREHCSMHQLCTLIDMKKGRNTSLTAAIRVFLMLYYRAAATEEGHSRAGHGDFTYMCHRAGVNKANGRWPLLPAANEKRRAAAMQTLQVRYS